jgi:ketosteroid isomerase-like protein
MTSETEIRSVVGDWAAAMSAKDIAGVMVHTAADCAIFSLSPPLRTDPDPAELSAWFETWRGPIGYEIAELAVVADGGVAFCHGLTHMTGTKTDGEAADLWFRLTLGLRRVNSAWTIVHENDSVPFYMDGSFKAAVDLKP